MTEILRTDGLTKRFGSFTALNGVSVGFQKGALTGVIGPNGAGKSTFFNLLTGAFPPTSGRITYEGRDITAVPQHRYAAMGIAKSFQITNVFPQLTALENVRVASQALVSRFDPWRPRSQAGGAGGAGAGVAGHRRLAAPGRCDGQHARAWRAARA